MYPAHTPSAKEIFHKCFETCERICEPQSLPLKTGGSNPQAAQAVGERMCCSTCVSGKCAQAHAPTTHKESSPLPLVRQAGKDVDRCLKRPASHIL